MILPHNWDLPEQIKIRFGEKSPGKQRAMVADHHLLLILHKIPEPDESKRKTVFFWRNPEGEWKSSSGGGKGVQALRNHIDAYKKAESKLDDKYNKAQDATDYFEILETISPVKHAAKNMLSTLQAAREAITGDREIIDCRDSAINVDRDLELLYTDTRNALDFAIAKRSEEQSMLSRQALTTGHRLNILAAIFFPLMAVSSIFGMNLKSGLENSAIWIFWTVFCAGLLLGIIICTWALADTTPASPSSVKDRSYIKD